MNLIKPLVPQPVANPAGIKALPILPFPTLISFNLEEGPWREEGLWRDLQIFGWPFVGRTQTIKQFTFSLAPNIGHTQTIE